VNENGGCVAAHVARNDSKFDDHGLDLIEPEELREDCVREAIARIVSDPSKKISPIHRARAARLLQEYEQISQS
jgi:hypothetical protein